MTGDLLDNLAYIDDIEDIIGENDVKPKERYKNKNCKGNKDNRASVRPRKISV